MTKEGQPEPSGFNKSHMACAHKGTWHEIQVCELERENQSLREQVARLREGNDIFSHMNAELTQSTLAAEAALRGAERDAKRLRLELTESHRAGFELTSRLCGIAVVAEKDGYELIRRNSAMDFVVRWRQAFDERHKRIDLARSGEEG